jgi:hypothetical protein
VRFIITEMFKLIDRPDLIVSVRKIAGKKRLANYNRYWEKLRQVVDHQVPFVVSQPPIELTRLPRPEPRVRYSRPQGPVHPQPVHPQPVRPLPPSSSSRASVACSSRQLQT